MSDRNVLLFCEDVAHETVLSAILQIMAQSQQVGIRLKVRSATGGSGKVMHALRQFIRELKRDRHRLPDLLVIGRDANCQGVSTREKEFKAEMEKYGGDCVCAIPDPHVERWLLLDSAAFKSVFGHGCNLPDQKCDKGRYKDLLEQAIVDSGRTPLLGGIEHAADIVEKMDFVRVEKTDPSFGRFLKELRIHFNRWKS